MNILIFAGGENSMLVPYIISALVFIVISFILTKFSITRIIAFLEVPLILTIISFIVKKELKINEIFIGGAVLLFIVLSSGSYEHETKSGKADKRYRSNNYESTFSENIQDYSRSGLIGLIVFGALLYFKIVDPNLWGILNI